MTQLPGAFGNRDALQDGRASFRRKMERRQRWLLRALDVYRGALRSKKANPKWGKQKREKWEAKRGA
tara:strand:+ start:631 stop:831 length:201 start_codon:yes stop_codon:yes gene_type:complete